MHIGKSSCGWKFLFQGYNNIIFVDSLKDWKVRVEKGGKIFDEYGEEYSLEKFLEIVERKKNYKSHLDEPDMINEDMWIDNEGNEFYGREFS